MTKLIVHDLDTETSQSYSEDSIPAKYRWVFAHLIDEEQKSISMGTTVFELDGVNWQPV